MEKHTESINQQPDITIPKEHVIGCIQKMNDWKAPGPDMVHGYWIKTLTSLHSRIAKQIQDIINRNAIPPELCKGRTVLIQKDINKGTTPSN